MNGVRSALATALLTLAGLTSISAGAVDDPDASDLTARFVERAAVYERRLSDAAGGAAQPRAAADYAAFLDAELNRAYRLLVAVLAPEERQALVESQRQWLAYRDAEGRFVARRWTTEAFGTSSSLSRAMYRTRLVKERTMLLLDYLRSGGGKGTDTPR